MSGPQVRVRSRQDLQRQRRRRSHACWDHLLIAPLWPKYDVELAGEAIRLADLPPARKRTIAVLGHERTGIPPEALDQLDQVFEIPMIGTGASLNVAVAGSLVLYRLAGLS
jgi:hypothetical protein